MAKWARTASLSAVRRRNAGGDGAPFQIQPGAQADLRTTLIVLAGLFGRPWVVASTAAAAIIFRSLIGGARPDTALYD